MGVANNRSAHFPSHSDASPATFQMPNGSGLQQLSAHRIRQHFGLKVQDARLPGLPEA